MNGQEPAANPASPLPRDAAAILGEAGVRRVLSPIEEPSGLPNAAFWSEEWLRLENERIFRRSWVFAGAVAELDLDTVKPVEIGGTPIILVRDGDAVRAFHNVCRHRGTRLVSAPCRKSAIVCAYHAWNYRLDGSLRSRPHFHGPNKVERFEAGARPDLALHAVRTEVWNGCVFVDLSGEAPPLVDWLKPLLERTRAFDFSQIRWIGKQTFRFRSNWKLVLENWMEGYHVFAAHPRLIDHAPMDVRWSGEWMDHVFYNDYLAPRLSDGRGEGGLPHFPGLSEDEKRRGMWFTVFPTFCAEVYADQFVVLSATPVAPDETVEELHFFVVGDEAATAGQYEAGRASLMSMWHDLNLEDVTILEELQQGRRSMAFEGSLMSPAWEVPAHQLAQRILFALADGEPS
jgi:choline monooxygenase